MDVGIVGLGRMGSGVSKRLLQAGHRVVVFNRSADKVTQMEGEGAVGASSLQDLVEKLPTPRTVWLYLPSGEVTKTHIQELSELLEPGDVVLDGGNSRYTSTLEHSALLQKKGIELLDVGTSGGITGEKNGYCLMMGGTQGTYERLIPLWQAVAQENGFELVGPVASGHYVKMVHNAIEYGMMQAYGEGMELLSASRFANELDFGKVTKVWQNGSIITSFLGGLLAEAISESPKLEEIGSRIDDNGEGRWAVEEALTLGVSVPVFTSSIFARYESRKLHEFGHKVVAILRAKFGGHAVEVNKK